MEMKNGLAPGAGTSRRERTEIRAVQREALRREPRGQDLRTCTPPYTARRAPGQVVHDSGGFLPETIGFPGGDPMHRLIPCVALALALAAPGLADADYPTHPVKVVSPYPPGGTVDILSRLISGWLQEKLGQPRTIVAFSENGMTCLQVQ